ncbi:hypothetical protein F2P81_017642 [Scophthalmus maximus]|uniref:Uncharacterized protein n=1 Tax=Scophthalmus maximus TaxID=52904 RepID=A0A6A4SIF3_SCOMX|nr:hypothetical protein F2P81_017642 [Scophthalmus maximus]
MAESVGRSRGGGACASPNKETARSRLIGPRPAPRGRKRRKHCRSDESVVYVRFSNVVTCKRNNLTSFDSWR